MVLGVSLKGFIRSSTAYQQNPLVLVDNVATWMSAQGYVMDLSFVTQFYNVPILDWVKGYRAVYLHCRQPILGFDLYFLSCGWQ